MQNLMRLRNNSVMIFCAVLPVKSISALVLMITVTVGGQEAATSVELAKPTGGDIPSKDISGNVDVNDTTEKLEEKVDYDGRTGK